MSIVLFLALCANQYASADTSNVCGVSGVLRRPGGPTYYARFAGILQQESSVAEILFSLQRPIETNPDRPRSPSETIRRLSLAAALALWFIFVLGVFAAARTALMRSRLLLFLFRRTRLARPLLRGTGFLWPFLLRTRCVRLVGSRLIRPCLILPLERLEVLLLPDVVLRNGWLRPMTRLTRVVRRTVHFLRSWLRPIRLCAVGLRTIRLGAVRLGTLRLRSIRLACATGLAPCFVRPRTVDSRHCYGLRVSVIDGRQRIMVSAEVLLVRVLHGRRCDVPFVRPLLVLR